jgi:hypothetical protein
MLDLPSAWFQVCACGRTFSLPQAYTCHGNSCHAAKKRFAGALDKAREDWNARKRRKIEAKKAEKVIVTEPNLPAEAPVPHEV